MISCKLYGQLGNQMFQYAATIGTALKFRDKYLIPNRTLNEDIWKSHHFENVNYRDISKGQILVAWEHWREPSHSYTEIPEPSSNRLMLDGYFQSYKYFQDYLPAIRKAFGFIDLETKKGICSIHVRRGDYLKYPDKHPVVSQKYLLLAIEEMFHKTGINKFLVFGDDVMWNKDFFKNIFAINENDGDRIEMKFEFSENSNEIEDLRLMASCAHNIISNSTFSWWAAYLNNNQNKIIITPDESNWFGPANKHLDVKDLLPQNWLRIKY